MSLPLESPELTFRVPKGTVHDVLLWDAAQPSQRYLLIAGDTTAPIKLQPTTLQPATVAHVEPVAKRSIPLWALMSVTVAYVCLRLWLMRRKRAQHGG
jgi:hypothetical protein